MASNPLIGAAWGGQQQNPNNVLQNTNPIQLPNTPGVGPAQGALGSRGSYGNPGGYSNAGGANEINRNMGLTNIIAGQQKNALAPQFAQLMGQYGGQAGNLFSQLTNLGSPYYQQKQTEGFNQGVNQNQNAQAMAGQQLRAQGYGSTPSGANAAMIGGMQQAGAQSLAEQYLQNLFNNEQMQLYGGQGLSQLAGMFNPTQVLGGTSVGANVQAPSTFFQNFDAVTSGLGSLFGGAGQAMAGYGKATGQGGP